MNKSPDNVQQAFQESSLGIVQSSLAYIRSPERHSFMKAIGLQATRRDVMRATIVGPRGIGHTEFLLGLAERIGEPIILIGHPTYKEATQWSLFRKSELEKRTSRNVKILAIDGPHVLMTRQERMECFDWWLHADHEFDLLMTMQSDLL